MGTNYVMRNGLMAAMGVSALVLSACAGGHGSRYASIYDYESGGGCGSDCGVAYNQPAALAPVYADCGQVPAMGCVGPAPVAAAPMPAYVEPMPTYSSPPSMAPTVGSYSTGVISSGSSYSSGTISSSAVDCPAGTTLQPDNTCLQMGSSFSSGIFSGPSYISSTTSSTYVPTTTSTTMSSSPVTCPAGTTLQSDNTCLQMGGSSSYSSHISTVTTMPTTTTTHHGGYTSSGSYTATDYLPIRK